MSSFVSSEDLRAFEALLASQTKEQQEKAMLYTQLSILIERVIKENGAAAVTLFRLAKREKIIASSEHIEYLKGVGLLETEGNQTLIKNSVCEVVTVGFVLDPDSKTLKSVIQE